MTGQGKMEALALIGSPRKQGNTDIMADEVLVGAKTAGATASKIVHGFDSFPW